MEGAGRREAFDERDHPLGARRKARSARPARVEKRALALRGDGVRPDERDAIRPRPEHAAMTNRAFELQPTLRGKLVTLRPLTTDDWDELFAVASDPLIWE